MKADWGANAGALLGGTVIGALLAQGAAIAATALGLPPFAEWLLAVGSFVVGFFVVLYAFYRVFLRDGPATAEPT